MGNLLIAAPVYKRAWVLPYWLKAIENQNFDLSKVGFVFELGPDDDETHDVLWNWQLKHPELVCFNADIQMTLSHQSHPEGKRVWGEVRYLTMSTLRNNLLEKATAMSHQFDHYLSLDSDILLKDPNTINKLLDYANKNPKSVISPLSYMTPDSEDYPSVMSWVDRPGGRATRRLGEYPIGDGFHADIVMAVVLMPREIYTKVRYRGHRQGEDLGFAAELNHNGFKSFAASDIYCPHIMHQYMLDTHAKSWLSLDD